MDYIMLTQHQKDLIYKGLQALKIEIFEGLQHPEERKYDGSRLINFDKEFINDIDNLEVLFKC